MARGIAGGVLVGQRRLHWARRSFFALVIIGVSWHGPISIFTRTVPKTHRTWSGGVCLQSTASTCGPAALTTLTTLLAHHGIDTDEGAMAQLCLTGKDGTHLTGLYRGLSLSAPRGMSPRIAAMTVDELRAAPERLPAVVSLMLTRELADKDPRYESEWGWDVGVLHSVVLLGFEHDNKAVIGDPGVGREQWSVRGLAELWAGEVLYLERDE